METLLREMRSTPTFVTAKLSIPFSNDFLNAFKKSKRMIKQDQNRTFGKFPKFSYLFIL